MARWFIIAGVILIVIGLLLYVAPWLFSWLGKLPGDIRIENENSKFYFPITSMVVISVILTIVINIVRHLGK
ncbi:DUF2905 domain-containing protein [Mariniphaga sp.]|uniref:DUF2905 domain-containing protein n=1 Tax=Mariniphaga sp. TaxID=1954475 RepID=UPI003565EE1E